MLSSPLPDARTRRSRLARRLALLGAIGLVLTAALHGLAVAGAADAGSDDPAPLVISHRGASAAAPEHTFAAYDRVVAAGTDVLECDLQLTKDEVLVCLHDTTVDRTTGGTAKGRVGDFTLEQLRDMDFGTWFGAEFAGAKIVPFEEQLRCYAQVDPDLQFEAETKAPSEYAGRMEPALIRLLTRLDLIPDGAADLRTAPVIVQSFELESLETVKQLAPSLPTAWLFVAPTPEVAFGVFPDAVDAIAPAAEYLRVAPALIDLAHDKGLEVQTWTVDDPDEIDTLLDAGVDGIFTNDTATLRERVDTRTGAQPQPTLDFERDCPGIAGTVTAASTAAADAGEEPAPTPLPSVPSTGDMAPLGDIATSGPAAATSTADSSSDDLPDWAYVVLIALLVGFVGGIGAWMLRRHQEQ